MQVTTVLLPFLHFLSTSFQNRLLGFISGYMVFVRNMKCPPQAARVGACLPADGIWGSNHIHRSLAQLRNRLPTKSCVGIIERQIKGLGGRASWSKEATRTESGSCVLPWPHPLLPFSSPWPPSDPPCSRALMAGIPHPRTLNSPAQGWAALPCIMQPF